MIEEVEYCIETECVRDILDEIIDTSFDDRYWTGIRDNLGKFSNLNWHEDTWTNAWDEYIILADQVIQEWNI